MLSFKKNETILVDACLNWYKFKSLDAEWWVVIEIPVVILASIIINKILVWSGLIFKSRLFCNMTCVCLIGFICDMKGCCLGRAEWMVLGIIDTCRNLGDSRPCRSVWSTNGREECGRRSRRGSPRATIRRRPASRTDPQCPVRILRTPDDDEKQKCNH